MTILDRGLKRHGKAGGCLELGDVSMAFSRYHLMSGLQDKSGHRCFSPSDIDWVALCIPGRYKFKARDEVNKFNPHNGVCEILPRTSSK